ncbi:rhombotarget lipoprotein [Zoogloea sp.]|uniref:rhombotarget lipoprotein n=1 Tax=Zoogloea sp. TaxID=49181 RepID=UPI0035AF1B8E
MKPVRWIAIMLSSAALAGCASWFNNQHRTAERGSVVEYLYPQGDKPALKPSLPELHLPLWVGIAFVPGDNYSNLGEGDRNQLIDRVKAAFANRPYIAKIETIPSNYLRSRGGFGNLEQAARMFNVDVVVLLSYDQVQFTDTNRLSLLYWTIVGSYLINGNQYDVNTLVDASVFDVSSRSLLFRAPGTSQVKGTAPRVILSEDARQARAEGFRLAVEDLLPRLDAQLENFRTRIREEKAARIVRAGSAESAEAAKP